MIDNQIKINHIRAFMDSAKAFAKLSKCTRLKVGCVAVKNGTIIAIGWNGLPPDVEDDSCEYFDDVTEKLVTKYSCRHAEKNMILHLAKSNESSKDATLVVTHAPCVDCSHMLKDSGFVRVIYGEKFKDMSGVDMLQRHGIRVEQLESDIINGSNFDDKSR